MKNTVFQLLTCIMLLNPVFAHSTEASSFSFGVIAKPTKAIPGEAALREALAESDDDNLAFVVANGIKAADEPCTDAIYKERRSLLANAKNGLIVSITASDWAQCVNARKRSIATERISRLRDMFFTDEFSFGESKIPLIRQSTMPKFRMYAENMRWRIGNVLFATINLPANDNNYLNAAGRNSEFEDRQIANSDWLKRIFLLAKIEKLNGIVLFCDGDPLMKVERSSLFSSGNKREGFADIRRQILALAAKFHGRLLIVHSDQDSRQLSSPQEIAWHGNVGALRIDAPWRKITVNPALPELFVLENQLVTLQAAHQ